MSEKVTSMGNIQRVIAVDMVAKTPALYFDTDGNFVDEFGFFIRSGDGGELKFCPILNKTDAEAITKTFDASNIFTDPVVCRKIIHAPTSPVSEATSIYVGYGV